MESIPLNTIKIKACVRVEPGCLGPQGHDLISGFCQYANEQMLQSDDSVVEWHITPRLDKSLAEFEYHYQGRRLPPPRADEIFLALKQPRENIEESFYSDLLYLIEQYRAVQQP